ncbi:MAG: alpha/beta fold hydrolase [Pseudomonadota bacterium]
MVSRVDALIDAAYATALDFRVGKSFAAAYAALSEQDDDLDSLAGHIARARKIAASRQSSARVELPNVTLCLQDGLVASSPFDWDRLLSNTLRIHVPGHADLVDPDSWRSVALWSDKTLPGNETEAVFASFVLKDQKRQNTILRRARPFAQNPPKIRMVFPSAMGTSADKDTSILQRMLGLTARQAEIAQRVANGQSAGEIAGEMGIRVYTVRDHIKAIYERTELNKQTDLAVLVGELNMMASTLREPEDSSAAMHRRMTNFFWTKDGRRVCFSDCGDPNGRVVLKMHSSFGGRWVWEPTAQTLYNYGIRLLIVERPGVGMTEAAVGDRQATIVSDAVALLDHLRVGKVFGAATSGGTFELANTIGAHPDRFSGAVFISPRAFDVDVDENDYVSQVASLPLEAGALVMESFAASQTEESWRAGVNMVLEANPVDLRFLEDEALMDMHIRQQKSVIRNGYEGQLLEWKSFGQCRRPPELPDLPYAVVVGDSDNIANISKGVEDWSSFLDIEPVSVEGAGHLIFLTHTLDVVAAAGLVSKS